MQNWQGPNEIGVASYSRRKQIGKRTTKTHYVYVTLISHRVKKLLGGFFRPTDIKAPMILSLSAAQSSPVRGPVEYKKDRFYATR